MTSRNIVELKKILESDKRIIFAYLFGSYAEGKSNRLSDIDIAVFVDESFDMESVRCDIILKASDALRTMNVDVLILNKSSPFVVYSVIKTGKLLVSKNEPLRLSFIHKNLKEYLDMEYYRKRFNDALSKRIEVGKFGF